MGPLKLLAGHFVPWEPLGTVERHTFGLTWLKLGSLRLGLADWRIDIPAFGC